MALVLNVREGDSVALLSPDRRVLARARLRREAPLVLVSFELAPGIRVGDAEPARVPGGRGGFASVAIDPDEIVTVWSDGSEDIGEVSARYHKGMLQLSIDAPRSIGIELEHATDDRPDVGEVF